MILDNANFGPGGSLAAKHRMAHKFRGWIRKHAREIGVGYLREDSDVAGIFLAEDRDCFGQDVGKNAHIRQSVHPM